MVWSWLLKLFLRASCDAFVNCGITIAAKMPRMITTIKISTSVKPLLRFVYVFMFSLLKLCYAGLAMESGAALFCVTRVAHFVLLARHTTGTSTAVKNGSGKQLS